MKITPINQISFKAHTYKVSPKIPVITIQTDNKPYLGEEPYIVSPVFEPYAQSVKMIKEGQNYYCDLFAFSDKVNYHLDYADTQRKDKKDGRDYEIDCKQLVNTSNIFLSKLHHRPLIHAIKQGKTIGKLKFAEINNEDEAKDLYKSIKQPTILVINSLAGIIPDNPNIVGVICTEHDFPAFSHYSTQLRSNFDVCASILNPKVLSDLKKYEGRNIELSVKDNFIKYNATIRPAKPKEYPKISIPKLKYCDKILNSKDYTPDVIGAKAVNLRKLEVLKEQGKIDAIIPKSIALPYGFIENFLADNPNRFLYYSDEYCKAKTEAIKSVLSENGINNDVLMVRSSFNGEDLENFSAAGLYSTRSVSKSKNEYPNDFLYNAIKAVANSKNSKTTRQILNKYKINFEDIKPGIVLQNGITPDYKFTLYTDDGEGNIKIDLISGDSSNFAEGKVLPHVFTYNKNTGELNYNSIQQGTSSVTFDEQMNIIGHTPVTENLSDNKDLLRKLKQLSQDSITIEKAFGAPQDIEGGIKDGKIYLWQSRNIVNS